MFNFLLDAGNYEERCVDRHEDDDLIVSTARVSDGQSPYETGIRHPQYNDGKWVIVECYDTVEDAQEKHNEWVEKMTAKELPDKLIDCSNAFLTQIFNSDENIFMKQNTDR